MYKGRRELSLRPFFYGNIRTSEIEDRKKAAENMVFYICRKAINCKYELFYFSDIPPASVVTATFLVCLSVCAWRCSTARMRPEKEILLVGSIGESKNTLFITA